MVKGEKGTLILLVLYYISYYRNNNTNIHKTVKIDKMEIRAIITLFSIYLFCFMIEQGYI